ncbi:MAG: Ppx/GppA family phosphatase [Gemmatimonadetes bacterium]|jgi:exopolyphosphatase / guanosine-5'-triphosphate,3'-diphosphate pyrophosphatase|nr:Ppx/GppA family phosphatase [Gemmatimonadota bacterium]MBT4611026.1 Ppx/GppA family phosphatase [Gemmatimonadota bacterium]MBT5141777.1 Ppx/GppA family phosphatase [Gemmatimonadota bacterium]MBT5591080.1 Ppx/GppA family phosphatase [Gemmatimonadota bacterium]MBT5962854.1 Ppx/GppA family phosphatase [Gemmatimonadota bacterium]
MKTATTQRVAVIDLGSNTARLVVMEATPGYAYRLVDEIREVVRLRQGMTQDGLSDDAIDRAFSTLRMFTRFCTSTRTDVILATATSAVRDAANGRAFIDKVQQDLDLTLRILDGEEEAFYGVIGALNEVPLDGGAVLDIGGGSAQLSRIQSGRSEVGSSLTLGSLALTERFVSKDPVSAKQVKSLEQEISRQLHTIPWIDTVRDSDLVGLGGTIRNLAKIETMRQKSPLNTLHGFLLTRDSLDASIDSFIELPLAKRQRIDGLSPDRADIILAGALVVRGVFETLGVDQLTISTGGLREGLFLEHFWEHLDYPVIDDVRRFSVLNLARIYGYQKDHANHVRHLAGRLFDQLLPLHDQGAQDRELLDAAALLHDLGTIIAYDGHHKHSQTLIHYNGLAGFSRREICLIALLTRFHRKGSPDIEGYESVLNKRDGKTLTYLAAILRMAEFLERGRNACVNDVITKWDDDALRITLVADEHPAVEIWETRRNALPLMESAFGRRVVLDSMAAPLD